MLMNRIVELIVSYLYSSIDCSLTCDNKGIRAPNCSGCQCEPGYRGMLCEININEKCEPEDAQCVGQ